jgi:nucleotide-binding universal stress UspA family protein
MPLLASEAMKPKLCGPLMSQRENVTGIDPATCSADPSLRPDTVTTTGREIPCIARRQVTRSVTVAPEATAIKQGERGSEESLAAVQWAAVEAMRRSVPLFIVHVLEHHSGPAADTQIVGHEVHRRGWARHDLPHGARSALARAVHRAAAAAPGVDLRTAAVCGHADQLLTALTGEAALFAMGTRGTGCGQFSRLRLGSVALCLASRARCPVVFTTAGSRPDVREIVVGADGSDEATAALEFSFGGSRRARRPAHRPVRLAASRGRTPRRLSRLGAVSGPGQRGCGGSPIRACRSVAAQVP